jgi:hypothetical protein
VLHEMLEGQPPFPKHSAHATLVAHLTQAPPSLTSSGPEAAVLDDIVQRALAIVRELLTHRLFATEPEADRAGR